MMVVLEVADEDPVDLDLLEREGVQVRQRGVAGSEIIERDVDAEQLELAQDRYGAGEVIDQNTFGDLELEWSQARLEQDGGRALPVAWWAGPAKYSPQPEIRP
jgi:hypothetical protein